MRRAVVLCPGPSLATFDDDQEGLVIAVNRAAARFASDVWAAGDYELVHRVRADVLGTPLLFTTANSDSQLRDHYGSWRGRTELWESLHGFCPREKQWEMFSLTAAVVYAAWRGATHVDVYGADWAGTNDWDGAQAGLNRSDERWKLEAGIVNNLLTPWLAARGVEVRRCSPPKS